MIELTRIQSHTSSVILQYLGGLGAQADEALENVTGCDLLCPELHVVLVRKSKPAQDLYLISVLE